MRLFRDCLVSNILFPLAIQTSTLARLKLFELMNKLAAYFLVCDSCFYIENLDNPHRYIPSTVFFCAGKMKDELDSFKQSADNRPYISKFCSTATKS